jgi:hypothetical protein
MSMSSLGKLTLRFVGGRKSVMPTSNREATPYASFADFCLVFMQNMDRLYLLSLLLTGEHALAEKCFVSGIDNSQKGNPVFREWALSWARRSIIQSAIQLIQPEITHDSVSSSMSGSGDRHSTAPPAEIANILALPQFERFVFVISVLERYSSQECSLLLNCPRGDVIAARHWALQQIGNVADLQCKVVCIHSDKQMLAVRPTSVPQAILGTGSGLLGIVPRATTIDWDDHAVAAT